MQRACRRLDSPSPYNLIAWHSIRFSQHAFYVLKMCIYHLEEYESVQWSQGGGYELRMQTAVYSAAVSTALRRPAGGTSAQLRNLHAGKCTHQAACSELLWMASLCRQLSGHWRSMWPWLQVFGTN